MAIMRNETILLDFQAGGNDLVLRLDRDSLWTLDASEPAICELTITDCEKIEDLISQLSFGTGKSFEYEVNGKAGQVTVLIYIDYSADEIEIKCSGVSEVVSEATMDDVRSRSKRLSALYAMTSEYREANWRAYNDLKTLLQKQIIREIDICQRKVVFFGAKSTARAEEFKAQELAYKKILSILEKYRPPENAG